MLRNIHFGRCVLRHVLDHLPEVDPTTRCPAPNEDGRRRRSLHPRLSASSLQGPPSVPRTPPSKSSCGVTASVASSGLVSVEHADRSWTSALDEKRPSGPQLRNPNPRVAPELSARGETRLARVRVGEAWPSRRELVGTARATTAGGDESYHGDRRDHRENSDCDPGFSVDCHRLSPFVGSVVHKYYDCRTIRDWSESGVGGAECDRACDAGGLWRLGETAAFAKPLLWTKSAALHGKRRCSEILPWAMPEANGECSGNPQSDPNSGLESDDPDRIRLSARGRQGS